MQVNNVNCNTPNKSNQTFRMALRDVNTKGMTRKELDVLTSCIPEIKKLARKADVEIGLLVQGDTHTFDTQASKPTKNWLQRLFTSKDYYEAKTRMSHDIDSDSSEMKASLMNNVSSAIENYLSNSLEEGQKNLRKALNITHNAE